MQVRHRLKDSTRRMIQSRRASTRNDMLRARREAAHRAFEVTIRAQRRAMTFSRVLGPTAAMRALRTASWTRRRAVVGDDWGSI
eukprot:1691296-Pleurochrysis_carterae.AAC.1